MSGSHAAHRNDAEHYPSSHASIHDNPLSKKSISELKQLLKARGISHADCFEKDDLIQKCVDNGISSATAAPKQKAAESKAEEDATIPSKQKAKSDYPHTHASVEDQPLYKAKVHDLREALKAKGVSFKDCYDKDDLVQRCLENGITSI